MAVSIASPDINVMLAKTYTELIAMLIAQNAV